jgi:hypothetical protein
MQGKIQAFRRDVGENAAVALEKTHPVTQKAEVRKTRLVIDQPAETFGK